MSYTNKFTEQKLIAPPNWVKNNLILEVITGSRAYGCNTEFSDYDILSIAIPTKEILWPSLYGYIPGFDTNIPTFETYQKDKKDKKIKWNDKEYDLTIQSLIFFVKLATDGNPNAVETLFVPLNCVTYSSEAGSILRENRHLFLFRDMWSKYFSYAKSQMHKMSSNKRTGNRAELYNQHGFDVKFSYNLVRLIYQIEQILIENDLDLQKHKEHLKAIRRGEVSEQDIYCWFNEREKTLEKQYRESTIQQLPDKEKIKGMILKILESQYGNLNNCFVSQTQESSILKKIRTLLNEGGY